MFDKLNNTSGSIAIKCERCRKIIEIDLKANHMDDTYMLNGISFGLQRKTMQQTETNKKEMLFEQWSEQRVSYKHI